MVLGKVLGKVLGTLQISRNLFVVFSRSVPGHGLLLSALVADGLSLVTVQLHSALVSLKQDSEKVKILNRKTRFHY